ncbi:MAG TPA: nuclear transport factor 2 family protein [Solirubrobacterales bacterium]|nr:nuclear transport factor 2 family protein [Solirubrobacterales bacterium]
MKAGAEPSNEALELARKGFDHFNAGELEAFYALQHPEIVLVPADLWPERGTFTGIDAFKRFLSQFLDAFSTVRFEHVREPEVIGELALFRGHWSGAGATTGIQADSVDFSVVFSARDGLIDHARFFVSDEEARLFAAEHQARA